MASVAVVSGANAGIGKETAVSLAGQGYKVVMACRNMERAEAAATEIRERVPSADLTVMQLDLASQDSIRSFVKEFNSKEKKLDLLVNNAGINFVKRWHTPEGIAGVCQVNYLGPYMLTRLLEKPIRASKKPRIVNVSSVTHRYARIESVEKFLTDWRSGHYIQSKLGNVLFAYELKRRWPEVTSSAVDPGAVYSTLWEGGDRTGKGTKFTKGLMGLALKATYAPPSDGCQAVLHACSVDQAQEKADLGGSVPEDAAGGRFYARGLFASPAITWYSEKPAEQSGAAVTVLKGGWQVVALFASMADWSVRRFSGGKLGSGTWPVDSAEQSYDEKVAAELWEKSAHYCGLKP